VLSTPRPSEARDGSRTLQQLASIPDNGPKTKVEGVRGCLLSKRILEYARCSHLSVCVIGVVFHGGTALLLEKRSEVMDLRPGQGEVISTGVRIICADLIIVYCSKRVVPPICLW
jgi:hypothetical protein